MRICIVDDSKNIRDSLTWLLQDAGHQVESCESGEEALARLKTDVFDILFLDVMLPGRSGLEILAEISHLLPTLKVIMISGQADLNMAVSATKMGAYDFFDKPLNPEKILLELKKLQDQRQMEKEVSQLKELIDAGYQMVGSTPAMQELRQAIERAAPSDSRILIYGENGTGKELVARQIHQKSQRQNNAFLKLNCAAIPKELIESELFGHERGAFTGAVKRKPGLIEEAEGGTLLLDEVGDMAAETQAKLLRVLQENEFLPVGGTVTRKFDVRIISATNKDLPQEILKGTFREDLYFRLNVIPIRVPPLRERAEDIPLLIRHFLAMYAKKSGKKMKNFDPGAIVVLRQYHWPGNIRELGNLMERLAIMVDSDTIRPADIVNALPPNIRIAEALSLSADSQRTFASLHEQMEAFEKQLLAREFSRVHGNTSKLAEILQTDRANLHRKLKRYGIKN